MRPIVDGLEAQYGDQIDFLFLNAGDGSSGQAAFDTYALRGHPTVLLVEPDGTVSWQGVGIVNREMAEQQIQAAIHNSE